MEKNNLQMSSNIQEKNGDYLKSSERIIFCFNTVKNEQM